MSNASSPRSTWFSGRLASAARSRTGVARRFSSSADSTPSKVDGPAGSGPTPAGGFSAASIASFGTAAGSRPKLSVTSGDTPTSSTAISCWPVNTSRIATIMPAPSGSGTMLPVFRAPADSLADHDATAILLDRRGERLGRRGRVAVDQDGERALDPEQVAVRRLLVAAVDAVALHQDRAGIQEAAEHLRDAGAAAVAAQVHDPALAAGLLALLQVVVEILADRPAGRADDEGDRERREAEVADALRQHPHRQRRLGEARADDA